MSPKQLTRREFLRVSTLTSLGIIAAACVPAPTAPAPQISAPTVALAGPRTGGTLRLISNMDGVSIGYPAKQQRTAAACQQVSPAVETLLRLDKAGKPIPWLATDYKNDVTGKTITLTLRTGVKFHDGTDFNADAVKWNLEQCIAAKTAGAQQFKSVEAVDSSTARINLTDWDSRAVGALTQAVGMMVSPAAATKNGLEWAANNPVGTGPFQFVSWQKDVKTTFKRFDGYWQKGKPYLDAVEWTVIADQVTQMLSLRKGEADVANVPNPKDIPGLEKEGFVVTRGMNGSGARSLVFDAANSKSPFADIRVRQAAQYAIDGKTMVDTLFLGLGEAANQWIYKGHWGYNPDVVCYPYNPDKAKQLLADAGYPSGFKTKLLYLGTGVVDYIVSAQAFLQAVGIDAQLEAGSTGVFDKLLYEGAPWDGMVYGTSSGDPDVVATLASKYRGSKSYANMPVPEDYAQAITNAIAAPDFETKQKYAQQTMKLMVDKYCLMAMLYCPATAWASRPFVQNHGFVGNPIQGFWTPEDAWIDKAT